MGAIFINFVGFPVSVVVSFIARQENHAAFEALKELLYKIFMAKLRINDIIRWQIDVLYFWFQDGMGALADQYLDPDNVSGHVPHHGTPPRSRRASEGAKQDSPIRLRHRMRNSSTANFSTI